MVKVKRFTAAWCGPCKQLAPIFEQLQSQIPGIIFETIDVDMDKDVALENGVTSIPTVIIEKDGQQVQRFIGIQPKSIYTNTIKSLI
jgi:thioredoxin 1